MKQPAAWRPLLPMRYFLLLMSPWLLAPAGAQTRDAINPTMPRQELPASLGPRVSWLRLRFRLDDSLRQRQRLGEPGYQPQVGVRTLVLNQQVPIHVTDNGTAMSEAVQQKIFQSFFTTKPTGEGTGLGLSLSYTTSPGATTARCRSKPR